MTARRLATALLRARAFFRRDDGVSAIEFALLAPVLFFAVIAMLDLGLALYERMSMDRLLRGGAQAAMADPGEAQVEAVIRASAETDFAPDQNFALTVNKCACPADLAKIGCTDICDGSAPGTFYSLRADRKYSGILLSPDLEASVKVKVR